MGLPQDPRRTGRPGSEDSGIDSVGDPEGCRNRPRAATDRASLVAVPAFSGRGDPGMRLLQHRPARRHPGLRPGRDSGALPGAQVTDGHAACRWPTVKQLVLQLRRRDLEAPAEDLAQVAGAGEPAAHREIGDRLAGSEASEDGPQPQLHPVLMDRVPGDGAEDSRQMVGACAATPASPARFDSDQARQ